MYALINDIESYPSFVPWCTHARVDSRSESEIVATLGVKRAMLHTEFTTRNTLEPERAVHLRLIAGPFSNLEGSWHLTPIGDAGTRIDFELRFKFSNVVMSALLEPLFESTAGSLVDAFVARARQVDGASASRPPSQPQPQPPHER